MSVSIEKAITKFIEIRDQRAEMKRVFEEQDFRLKEAQGKIEVWLMRQMEAQGVESSKTAVGTAYIAPDYKVSCADWPSMWGWMAESGNLSMLEKRLSVGAVREYVENTGGLPPFVNMTTERVVRVRRS